MLEGLLLVNKPRGVTSHDAVEVVRRKLGMRRVGHTGTLDPIAEGLLILLVGSSTKHQQAFQAHEKTYEAVLRLGTQTDTGDADGTPIGTAPVPVLEHAQLTDVLASFVGPLTQIPPVYSAVKVRGRPAYWWARRHQPVALAPRRVQISEMTLVEWSGEQITFRVCCSAGTYIRTMAESIAERLGTVGHLDRLIRLSIGRWRVEEARPLAWIKDATPEMLIRQLLPCASSKVFTP